MKQVELFKFGDLPERIPVGALVNKVDLVAVRYGDKVSVLYGRCLHRGALMTDGYLECSNLVCGVHGWDYRFDTGVSECNNSEVLRKFQSWIEDGKVWVDEAEILAWEQEHPPPYNREECQGADLTGVRYAGVQSNQ